jgi:hypothetical protein
LQILGNDRRDDVANQEESQNIPNYILIRSDPIRLNDQQRKRDQRGIQKIDNSLLDDFDLGLACQSVSPFEVGREVYVET